MNLFVRTCNTERMNIMRLLARAFVVIGGLVWGMMLFASNTAARYADLTYSFTEVIEAGFAAALPLAVAVLVFVLGLFYERLAAGLLLLAAAGTVVFGVVTGWDTPILWASVMLVVVAPLVIAAALFMLASSTQRVCELEESSART